MTEQPTDDDTTGSDRSDVDPDPEPDPSTSGPGEPVAAVAIPADATTVVDVPQIPGQDEFLSLAMQAKMYAASSLVPSALRNKPADVLLVLMTGRDLGITPTAALRKCYVVDGSVTVAPALKAAIVSMKGLGKVRPPGRFMPGVHDAEGRPIPDPDFPNTRERATAIALDPSGMEIARYTMTRDDVDDITINSSGDKLVGKDNWRNYPGRMLYHRVQGYLIDDIWPEATFGMYDPDSLGAITDESGELIELDSVEVPPGFVRERRSGGGSNRPNPDAPLTADEADALRNRASALPEGGKEALRAMARAQNVPLVFSDMTNGRARKVTGFLDNIEGRAARGEWGDWSPPEPAADPGTDGTEPAGGGDDDDITDVCGDCGEAVDACECDQPDNADTPPDEPDVTVVMDPPTLAMVLRLPDDGLAAIGVDELRAACRAAFVEFDDDCDAEDLVGLLRAGTEPMDAQ
jgi:hypothetical protein